MRPPTAAPAPAPATTTPRPAAPSRSTPAKRPRTIQVSIIDDSVVDNNETLTITLSNASGADISDGQATGTITDGDTETSPLTAAFQELPSSHDGSAEFAFQVLFSEDVGISYVNMRDDAFTVTDGDVQTAKRVDGRHDLWKITVEPDDNSDVVITLPANRSCTTAGAICTREDTPRQLTNSPSATVPGPTDESSSDSTSDSTEETTTNSQLSVADATASEEDDSTIDFVVTLNPAGEANITVDYATANGTASAGSDYTAQSGTLTFTAGETSKTVTVAIIDDSTEESDETLTLTLSNPSGAEISDGQATGTIADSEPVPLTASFSNVPDSHDGSTEFTFDLTFSEHFPLSYVDAARPCLHKGRAKRRPHRLRPAQGAGQQPDLDHYRRTQRQRGNHHHAAGDHRLHRLRRDLHRRRPEAVELDVGLSRGAGLTGPATQAQRRRGNVPSPPRVSLAAPTVLANSDLFLRGPACAHTRASGPSRLSAVPTRHRQAAAPPRR